MAFCLRMFVRWSLTESASSASAVSRFPCWLMNSARDVPDWSTFGPLFVFCASSAKNICSMVRFAAIPWRMGVWNRTPKSSFTMVVRSTTMGWPRSITCVVPFSGLGTALRAKSPDGPRVEKSGTAPSWTCCCGRKSFAIAVFVHRRHAIRSPSAA